MKSIDFKNWFVGFIELNQTAPTEQQWEVIKEHLSLVFNKVTTRKVYVAPFRDVKENNGMEFYTEARTC